MLVGVGVDVGVDVGFKVLVGLGVLVGVGVEVGLGVLVGVGVGLRVPVGVRVGTLVGVGAVILGRAKGVGDTGREAHLSQRLEQHHAHCGVQALVQLLLLRGQTVTVRGSDSERE